MVNQDELEDSVRMQASGDCRMAVLGANVAIFGYTVVVAITRGHFFIELALVESPKVRWNFDGI